MSSASRAKFLLKAGCGAVEKSTSASAGRSFRLSRSMKMRPPPMSDSRPLRLVSSESMRFGSSRSATTLRRRSLMRRSTKSASKNQKVASSPAKRASETRSDGEAAAVRSGRISIWSSLSEESWLEISKRRIESTSSPKKSTR